MKIDIGAKLNHTSSTIKIDLPKSTEPYYEVYAYEGRGDFISAVIRFNSDSIDFKMVIDDKDVLDLDLKGLKDLVSSGEDKTINHCIQWDKNYRSLLINFGLPVQFSNNISFYARSSTTSSSRDLKSYSIMLANGEE